MKFGIDVKGKARIVSDQLKMIQHLNYNQSKMPQPIRFILPVIFLSLANFTTIAQSNQYNIRPHIAKLVDKLRKDNYVHFGYAVGYNAVRETNNKYYKLYLKLKEKATDDELIQLTSDSAKNIVVYSFAILQSKNFENLKSVFLNHINDTTFYWTAGGCTGFVDRVNWYMLRELRPKENNRSSNYLTRQEYEQYCAKFKKDDPTFFYD